MGEETFGDKGGCGGERRFALIVHYVDMGRLLAASCFVTSLLLQWVQYFTKTGKYDPYSRV